MNTNGNVQQLDVSRSTTYRDTIITCTYDYKIGIWMYGFSLDKITDGLLPSIVFGHAQSADEGFELAKQRLDKMYEAYRGPSERNPHHTA